MNIMDTDQGIPRRKRGENTPSDKFFKIRNILNTIFLLGAVVGLCIYFFSDKTAGTITILGAMVFKTVECCLRFFK